MTAEQIVIYIVFPVIGYLLGSIPFAWVIGKMRGVDIRTVGSKNIGATNLGRTLGKRFFWQAFLLDAAKGFLPVLIASLLVRHFNQTIVVLDGEWSPAAGGVARAADPIPGAGLPVWAALITAAACVIGHLFPIWLKFKGGKGVATGFGVVLGFWPLFTLSGLAAGMFFVAVLMVYRFISLASISSAIFFAGLVAVLSSSPNRYYDLIQPIPDRYVLIGVACGFALLIILRHRGNIGRLMKGTEPQIGQKEVDKAKMK
jgi:acyl phosphate:glycerol-3-phosphate acyltransferase